MITKKEILEILEKKLKTYFAPDELIELKYYVNDFPDTATIEDIAKEISSKLAYVWIRYDITKDVELMRDKIRDSEHAFYWATNIGDKELMRDKIMESEWAYKWALRFSDDREFMRDKVWKDEWVYHWAASIGDRQIMWKRMSEKEWMERWIRNIGYEEALEEILNIRKTEEFGKKLTALLVIKGVLAEKNELD